MIIQNNLPTFHSKSETLLFNQNSTPQKWIGTGVITSHIDLGKCVTWWTTLTFIIPSPTLNSTTTRYATTMILSRSDLGVGA